MAEKSEKREKFLSREKEFLGMAEGALSDARMVQGKSDRLFWNSYYSLYRAKAALLSISHEARSHSGTDNQVGRVLYKEKELISSEEASFYSDIRRIREEMDYQPDATINRDQDQTINKAENLLKTFEELVGGSGM